MKVVIIGGTGLIGSKVYDRLARKGHHVVPASPKTGVNTISKEGLQQVLVDTDVVLDLANSPSFDDDAVLNFFEKSGQHLLAAESKAGVKHHIALSVVGAEGLPDSGYLRAKVAQEALIEASRVPYTIIRSTQFFEFLGGIAQSGTVGDIAIVSSALFQPISSDDVADIMAEVALSQPLNSVSEIGGPEVFRMSDLVAEFLRRTDDGREVIATPSALYFGAKLKTDSLLPGRGARLGNTEFDCWFREAQA